MTTRKKEMKMSARTSLGVVLLVASVAHGVEAATVVCGGLVREFKYDTPDKAPIYFGGWSRAEDARASDYCVYADVFHADGSASYAHRADFTLGTHDWESSAYALTPRKPVARIRLHAFLRNGSGRAEFRDVFLKREAPPVGTVFSSRRFTDRPYSEDEVVCEWLWDGANTVRRERVASDRQVVVTNPLGPDEVTVWTADSMRRVTPLTFPAAEDRNAVAEIEIARNEHESFQIIVSTGVNAEREGVTLEAERPVNANGCVLKGGVTWERQGYLPRRHPYQPHPLEPPFHEKWLPDPLQPAAPFKARKCSSQGTWITVFAAYDAVPGVYSGKVNVRAKDGKSLASVPFRVIVRKLALPTTFGLKTSFSYMDGFTKALYPSDWNALRREAHDILLDHRLNPDDITRTDPVRIEDVAHMKERGANAWNIFQISPPKNPDAKWLCRPSAKDVFTPGFYASFTNRLAPHVAALKAHNLFEGAYIYGFDECTEPFYAGMRDMYLKLKRDFPDLPVMTTARTFNDFCNGRHKVSDSLIVADWFCGSMGRYGVETADAVRGYGCKAWWYTSLGPAFPKMNFANWVYPFIEGRLVLGFCTWLYRTDGFLFWHCNNWREGKGAILDCDADTFFPDFRIGGNPRCPGDGVFLYPGKGRILPSIRLANIRDGEEDWEYLHMAEQKAGRGEVEKTVRSVVRSRDDFSRSPAEVRKVRSRLADLAEQGL